MGFISVLGVNRGVGVAGARWEVVGYSGTLRQVCVGHVQTRLQGGGVWRPARGSRPRGATLGEGSRL